MAENQQVGIIYSPWVEEAEPLANTLVGALSKGHKPWVCSVLDLEGNSDMAKRCSTFVTIGGDGTILRTVRLAAPTMTSILRREWDLQLREHILYFQWPWTR